MVSDSMLRRIIEVKLSSNIFIRKECFPGGTIKDMNSYIQEFDDTTPYTKTVIHIGTNDVFNLLKQKLLKALEI